MTSRKLDFAERWLRSGIEACHVPALFEFLDVDMTQAVTLIERAHLRGKRITHTHILVRGAALALARNPALHVMVCGKRHYQPDEVDVAVSVAGDSIAAPLLVVRAANTKSVESIADEISSRAGEVRIEDRQMNARLRRWGRFLPSNTARKRVLRFLFSNVQFRRKGAGTFQVSVLSGIDAAISPIFSASAVLIGGAVKDRVIAIDGAPAVRPVISLTCCADHRVWDGRAAEKFLLAVRCVLESSELLMETTSAAGGAAATGRGG